MSEARPRPPQHLRLARARQRDRRAGPEADGRLGGRLPIHRSAETTGGAFCIIVLEGEHVFQVGEEELQVGPGGLVFGPRGIPHAQRRVVPRTGRTLDICSPAGLEGFFRELAEAERSASAGPEAYARVSERYGITWL